MFEAILSKNARSTLAVLGKSGILRYFYLAGGTAAALQLGHRRSEDFDFFTATRFRAEALARKLQKLLPHFTVEKLAEDTLLARVTKTRFTVFFYSYPLIDEPVYFSGVALASLKDIAAMKLLAISDRGTKRDFIDLYFLMRDGIVSLNECFALYDRKYKALRRNKFHIVKSLTYFEDADSEKMPPMLRKASWREVKKFFEKEAKKLI